MTNFNQAAASARSTPVRATAKRRIGAAIVAGLLALISVPSFAQSCRQIAGAREDLSRQISMLAYRNPGSSVVFGSCGVASIASYQQSSDRTEAASTFGVCAGLMCMMTDGYANCLGVNMQLIALSLKDVDLKSRADRDC